MFRGPYQHPVNQGQILHLLPWLIAYRQQCLQNASMSIQITIRGIPESVRDELASRAAREGKSMQEYLKQELIRLAAKPPVPEWLAIVQERKAASQTRVSAAEILEARDTERR